MFVLVGNGPAMCAALRCFHSCVNCWREPRSPLGFVRFDRDEPWVCLIKGHMLGVLLSRCLHNQQPSNPQPGGLYHLQTLSSNMDHAGLVGGGRQSADVVGVGGGGWLYLNNHRLRLRI